MKKIGIIGAGISGLFIANLFKKNPKYQVSIFDKKKSLNLNEGYGKLNLNGDIFKVVSNLISCATRRNSCIAEFLAATAAPSAPMQSF